MRLTNVNPSFKKLRYRKVVEKSKNISLCFDLEELCSQMDRDSSSGKNFEKNRHSSPHRSLALTFRALLFLMVMVTQWTTKFYLMSNQKRFVMLT